LIPVPGDMSIDSKQRKFWTRSLSMIIALQALPRP